jgi:1-acyl-sn-glycerol-3-phosphate acyltransferase
MQEPIAIIGIGCRFPGGATSPASFWAMLVNGVDAVTDCPPERFDLSQVFDADRTRPGRMYTRWGGFVDGIDQFDAGFFGFSMREALRIDPQHRMLLEVAWEALEDAGLPADGLAGSLTGVFVGISTHDYADVQAYPGNRALIDAHTNSGGAGSIAANRISYVYDLRGPSFIVDTACSSSLVSVHLACQSLRNDECTLALAGGVQAVLNPELTIGFCKASMISPDGRCRAFSAEANGYVRGEGGGIVVLKRLSQAIADGDRIYALVRGSAINEDGRTNGMTVPGLPAQQEVLRQAYTRAGVAPGDVHYIEAHGPGTPVGDPIEAEALATVVACERPPGETLRIGSVKTNIGHLEAGSGIAGLVKAALVVQNRYIPPSLHFKTPNPAIPFEAYRLRVTGQGEAWPKDAPAFTGINSFGFGGANAHVVLEGPPPAPERPHEGESSPRTELLVTSARSAESLRGLARAYRDLCRRDGPPRLAELVSAAALQRSHHEHRLGVVGKDLETLADNLDAFANDETRADVVSGRASHQHPPRLAFVFAGMGPQWWGMGRQLLEREPVFRAVIEECDRLIRRHADWSLVEELLEDESRSRVAEADFAQPVNFAFQAALIALWKDWGVRPDAVVGHSAGEIAAVYAAGIMDLEESVRVAFHRGRLQHRASGKGRMLAVGLGLDALRPFLAGYEGRLAVAAVNSPTSVTLSGDTDAVEELSGSLQKQGAFCRVMSVQVPYHSHHMDPIEGELIESLAGLRLAPASTPIVSEVSGEWAQGGSFDAAYWWCNIRQPVLFGDAVLRLIGEGYDTFLEVSPHPVLGAAVKECLSHAAKTGACLPSLRRMDDDRAAMLRALAGLYARGVDVDWEKVLGRPRTRVALPLYAWNKERVWLESLPASATPEVGVNGHNVGILGGRVRTVRPHWEVDLKNPALAYLQDHRIHGAIVFPGAAYVAMALEAAAEIAGTSSVGLEGVEFRKALFIPETTPPRLQAVYDAGSRGLEIHAQNGANGNSDKWTLHAGCQLTAAPAEAPPLDLEAVRGRCRREVARQEFYDEVGKRGFTFGPRFMGVEKLFQGDGEALGYVRLPEAHSVEANGDRVHPALFDAGLQVLIGAVTSREQPRDGKWPAFLPTRAARVASHRPVGASFWSHATVEELTPESFQGTVSIHGEDGALLLQVQGLRAKTLEDIRSAEESSTADWLYHLVWEEKALPSPVASERPEPWCSPTSVAVSVAQQADRLSGELGFAGYYTQVEPALERIAQAFFARALSGLGIELRRGETFTTASLPSGTALSEPRRRQLDALVAALVEGGVLDANRDGFSVLRAPAPDDPLALIEELRAARPAWGSVLDVLSRCGLALADVLAGTRSAPEVLFSGEGLAAMAAFYRESPACRLFNALTAESVAAALAGFPEDRDLRVLEVGAGTGGTTRYVLPRLPEGRTRFVFTDVSPLFMNLARHELGEGGAIRYAALDIEREPAEQGFEPGSFDIVLASNVVHATADVARVLGRLRDLLAPGGLLVLQEITRRPRWLDVVFGITDGWWAFADTDLRPAHALLDPPTWQRVLAEMGLEEPATFSESEDALPGQSVLLARAPVAPRVRRPEEAWLVLADRQGVGDRLVESLRGSGRECLVALVGDSFRRLSRYAYEVPLGGTEAMAQLLQAVETEIGSLTGVVHLWSLDMPPSTPDTDAGPLLSSQRFGYGSLLDLLHALAAADRARLKRCFLVTAGAQPLDPPKDLTAVIQAPLWGFGRILVHEYPELHPALVDCSARPAPEEVEALAREVLAEAGEDEIALRGAHRYLRRLVRLDLEEEAVVEAQPEAARGRSFRAEPGGAGALDSIRLREFQRRRLADDEVEIEVKAASLNFRDVMFAMGMLPSAAFDNMLSAGALGVDCAGIVSAVGDSVIHVRPGDEVVALSPASLASHAITKDLVVPKPKAMSFEQAAALPLAYVTALYALETLAGLKPGERVLIHAASGGVGLAAVSVAQRAGAEIFATAGSEAKREYLRSRGVRHVMDSRSLDFAAQIMDVTRGCGVDVVLNSLSGEAIAKGLSVLAPRGRFLEIGKADIYRNSDLALQHFSRNLSFFAIQIDLLCDVDRVVLRERMQRMVEGIEDGTLAPLPTQVFPLSSLEEGLRTLAQARHTGKIVISVDDPDIPILPHGGSAPLFRQDATYLITGGRGGVGSALARWMVTRGARHLALMSRNAQAAEGSESVAALREQGAEVLLLSADVSQRAEVERALAAADRPEAPLKGVFHGAMVIDDAPLSELDVRRFEAVMAPKAAGAWNLHVATRERELDHFVLFSSITSVYGNARQGNYGAANAFLDSLAGHRRAQGLPGLTVNWGVFSDAGYVAERKELGEYLARQGQHGFRAEHGFAAMERLLRHGVVQATISKTEWPLWAEANPVMGASPRFRSLVQAPQRVEPEKGRGAGSTLDRFLALDPAQRPQEVGEHLLRRMARILGASPERVETKTPLTDMGMDSLMAVELMTALKGDLAIDLPAVKLLQGVTLDQLTNKVVEHLQALGGAVSNPAPPPRPPEEAPGVATPPMESPAAERPRAPAHPPAPPPEASPSRAVDVGGLDYAALDYSRWTTLQRIARSAVSGLVSCVAKVHAEGLENLPSCGPALIAANHLSMWDSPVLLRFSERRTVIFAAEELRKYPWMHWTLHKLWDAIYLKRGEGDTEAMEHALGVLRGGGVLGLSPEGIRSPEGLRRGLTGVAHLAFRSGAPIVPVVVYGQERIPQESRRLRRATVNVRVAAPLRAPGGEATAEALQALTGRVMLELARMLPADYRGVYAAAVEAPER